MTGALDIPTEWTFQTADVAEGFDAHVHEQLPWYDLVTAMIGLIGRHYITEDGTVYDLGAATGNVGRILAPTLALRHANLIAVDNSQEMVDRYDGPGEAVCADIATFQVAHTAPDLIVANLVLMFLNPADALDLIDRLVDGLAYGGALILVERFTPPSGYLGLVSSRLTLDAKLRGGATADEIIAKELSLVGVQRPLIRDAVVARGGCELFRFGDFSLYVIEQNKET